MAGRAVPGAHQGAARTACWAVDAHPHMCGQNLHILLLESLAPGRVWTLRFIYS